MISMTYVEAVNRALANMQAQEERRSPRLGLGVILSVCVPFWAAVAWWLA